MMHLLEWFAAFKMGLELARELRDFIKPQRDRVKTEREKMLEEFYDRQLTKIKAVRLIRAVGAEVSPKGGKT